ncbi:MAG: hypothetical protein WC120_03720 [Parcubacteria group bacterium]
MFEKSLLVLILFLQAIFSGLIFLNKETALNWNNVVSSLNLFLVIGGLLFGYYKLKKEIKFKKKLEIHGKLTSMLVQGLHKSFYALAPFVNNSFSLKKSNPKNKDDFFTNRLKENSKNLIEKISVIQSDFQVFYEFFQFWKALFSEKVDRESKFLFDLEIIFSDDLGGYQMKLSSYSMLSLMKDTAEIEKERIYLLALEEKISKESTALANGLDKFVSDMSREVFNGLYSKNKNVENRLFNLEIENSNDGDQMIILTENGFEYRACEKTSFHKKFGGFKERQEKLRNFLEQKL